MKRMDMRFLAAGVVLCLVFTAGCKQGVATKTDDGSPAPASTNAPSAASSAQTSKEAPATSATTPGGSTAAPASAEVPSEAKTAAFEYLGLAKTGTLKMKGTIGGQSKAGEVQTKLIKSGDGKALFQQDWNGELSQMGSSQISAEKGGVFITMVGTENLPKPQLELPADPKPGFTWTFSAKFKGPNGENVSKEGKDKIVGVQKVTAGGKSYVALLVEESGNDVEGTVSAKYTARLWLVKGLGPVKQQIDSVANGKKVNVTIELAE